ncbi:prepilin-type N-terminal cleavage/methylation domain-containing protein [Salmonella enterica]|nr:prepilin-type N-terminal cleavage/methylation domain-containing protein [Salmonella enterica]EKS5828614.1 prepilin-type N-terminal cleavage/methylation domain-containing protein [Salmonella enterica]EKS5883090.1 prepilin-type N-terminal cleavage/methylation domain-containing protein [Salmonella enterica]
MAYIKNSEKGFSIIEVSMALVLSAIVIAYALYYYQSLSDNGKLDRLSQDLTKIITSVNVLYVNHNDNYRGLDARLVAKLIPGIGKIDNDGRLILPTGNPLRIVGNYNYQGNIIWYFTVNNITRGMCPSILFTMMHMKQAANSPVVWYTYNENWSSWNAINPVDVNVDTICGHKFETIDVSMGFK